MIRLLLSAFRHFMLGLCSLSVGAAGFLIFKGKEHEETISPTPLAFSAIHQVGRTIPLAAEPSLLARTNEPVDLGGDALGVIYILQKDGKVVRVGNERSTLSVSTVYADLAANLPENAATFSAIAFHPEFLLQDRRGFGKFYAIASEPAGTANCDFIPEFGNGAEHHQDVVYEFSTAAPLAANFSGENREVVRFSQPGPDHNLAGLTFDHRGFLYLATGDGADSDVTEVGPSNNASSLTSAYGKILRIDPTERSGRNGNYGIPESNPFKMISNAIPELWAFGLRSPRNLHYDFFSRGLYIGESSLRGVEEVNLSHFGGEHFGWSLLEDYSLLNRKARTQLLDVVTPPSLALSQNAGQVERNAGNVIYRGEHFPSLAGRLIFASSNGRVMACDVSREEVEPQVLDLGLIGDKSITALRSTPYGELVLLCEDGSVIELRKRHGAVKGNKKSRPLYCSTNSAFSSRG